DGRAQGRVAEPLDAAEPERERHRSLAVDPLGGARLAREPGEERRVARVSARRLDEGAAHERFVLRQPRDGPGVRAGEVGERSGREGESREREEHGLSAGRIDGTAMHDLLFEPRDGESEVARHTLALKTQIVLAPDATASPKPLERRDLL